MYLYCTNDKIIEYRTHTHTHTDTYNNAPQLNLNQEQNGLYEMMLNTKP